MFPKNTIMISLSLCLLPYIQCMDVDNGGGNIIRGLPCTLRLNQLTCTSGGSIYPGSQISTFIDDNKALLRRMFGEQQEPQTYTAYPVQVVHHVIPHAYHAAAPLIPAKFASPPITSHFSRTKRADNSTINEEEHERSKRQSEIPDLPAQDQSKDDVCASKTEIEAPFWASNSNGKVRAIVNNDQFEQAVHQEICTQGSTPRCTRDCSCEQKYKWHRLLAYDPNNDCAGIFMDWFLFPSCCVCRCNKNPFLNS